METVTSKDGTRIAFWCRGEGAPLLLVHGATADHSTTWRLVGPMLERRFRVCVMDRRGRGDSGDAPEYDLRREAEDVAAVAEALAESADRPVDVVGHSFGALCALEAALLTDHVRRLILYEGVPTQPPDAEHLALIERLDALVRDGDREGALVAMYRDLVKMPPEELTLMRSMQEAWERRVANTASLPREAKVDEEYVFDPERFGGVRPPTLLLVGGESPPLERQNAEIVTESLPDARVAVLPGQQHVAMYTAPELFVSEVVRFLEG
jgi:pimeloyl-ACP methyl ester carboxylesterase